MPVPGTRRATRAGYLAKDDPRCSRVDALLRNAGIALAVVHGSRVRGAARADSDLDVGLLAIGGHPLSYAVMGRIALDLTEVMGVEVDVSDLSTPDAVFRFEVAGCARPLFEDTEHAFPDFVGRALVDYADIQRFLPALIAGVARGRRGVRDEKPSTTIGHGVKR